HLTQDTVLRAQIAMANRLIAEQSAAIARARWAIERAIESLREPDGRGRDQNDVRLAPPKSGWGSSNPSRSIRNRPVAAAIACGFVMTGCTLGVIVYLLLFGAADAEQSVESQPSRSIEQVLPTLPYKVVLHDGPGGSLSESQMRWSFVAAQGGEVEIRGAC